MAMSLMGKPSRYFNRVAAANHAVHTEHGIRRLQIGNQNAVPGDGSRYPTTNTFALNLMSAAVPFTLLLFRIVFESAIQSSAADQR